nr:unnamed protein product [Callosobruchus chinensis]
MCFSLLGTSIFASGICFLVYLLVILRTAEGLKPLTTRSLVIWESVMSVVLVSLMVAVGSWFLTAIHCPSLCMKMGGGLLVLDCTWLDSWGDLRRLVRLGTDLSRLVDLGLDQRLGSLGLLSHQDEEVPPMLLVAGGHLFHVLGVLLQKIIEIEPNADKAAVVRKINNLRSNVRKEKKKYEQSLKSGASLDDVYHIKLWVLGENEYFNIWIGPFKHTFKTQQQIINYK